MTIKHIDALVLRATKLEQVVRFYRAIGLPLKEEQHADGPLHYACELGQAHIAIYEAEANGDAPLRLNGGASMVGFRVDSVEAAFEAALRAGGKCAAEPDDYPWGRRALVTDPDGRAVELNEAPSGSR